MSMQESIKYVLTGDSSQLESAIGKAEGGVKGLEDAFNAVGQAITAGAFGMAMKAMVDEFAEASMASAKLDAVVKATGGSAGISAGEMKKLSGEIQKASIYSDDAATNAQAVLATFRNIKGDNFKSATRAMADMAAVMGGDLQGAAMQIGKALNDPTQGLSALSRAGVSFTEEQKEMIKSLQASGDLMGAQKIILSELEGEFGGAAEAVGKSFGGQLAQAGNAVADLQESLGEALAPTISIIAGALKTAAEIAQAVPKPITAAALAFGAVVAVAPAVVTAITVIKAAMTGLAMSGPGLIVAGVAAAVAGLASLIAMAQDARKEAEEAETAATRSFDARIKAAEDYKEKLLLTGGEVRRLRGELHALDVIQNERRRYTSLDPVSSAEMEKYSNLQKELTIAIALEAEYKRKIAERQSQQASDRAFADLRARQEAEKKAAAEAAANLEKWLSARASLLDRYKTDEQKQIEEISRIQSFISGSKAPEALAELESALSKAEGKLKDIRTEIERGTWDPVTSALEDLKASETEAAELQELFNEKLKSAATEEQREQLTLLGEKMGWLKNRTDEAKESQVEFEKAMGSLSGIFGGIDVGNLLGGKADSGLVSWVNENKKALDAFAGAIGQTFSAVWDGISAGSARALEDEISRIEDSLQAHNESTESQLEARERLGKDSVSFELAAAQDRERIENAVAKKKSELELKQFRAKQIQMAAEAAMQTAVAVTSAMTPYTMWMVPMILGMGAAQQGMIWSQQPPPALYDGGIIPGSSGGAVFQAGERNQSELILPLRKQKLQELGLGGGGIQVGNININGSSGDPRQMVDDFLVELRRRERQGEIDWAS